MPSFFKAGTALFSICLVSIIFSSLSFATENTTNKQSIEKTNGIVNTTATVNTKANVGLVINEVSTSFDWIELYNNSNQKIDLRGVKFTHNHKNNSFEYAIKQRKKLKPGYFYVIYKKSKIKMGFDFDIHKNGDIQLFSNKNILLDSLNLASKKIPKNGSLGRYPDGIGPFIIQSVSSSKSANNNNLESTRLKDLSNQYEPYVYVDSHQSDFIFDQNKLHRFDLLLEDNALSYLNDNPTDEIYTQGKLVFNNKILSEVGIRYKGSIGAFVECVSGKNMLKPSGKKKCTKLSMKVKIDWLDKQARFYGLKKLQFHSQNLDASKMHERLGYWLYQQFSVPAPRSVHAQLYINGEFNGIFALTEQIDDIFVKHHINKQNFDELYPDDLYLGEQQSEEYISTKQPGNLYKEVWPLQQNGQSTLENKILTALKTNKKEADISNFLEFAKVLEKIKLPQQDTELTMQQKQKIKNLMNQWFDMETIIRSIVVDRSIKADDGMLHWYCAGKTNCFNHNYYWYQSNNKKMYLIPWDLDNAFENLGEPKNPITYIEDNWNKTRNECQSFPSGPYYVPQLSAACDKLIYAMTLFEDEYNQYKMQFEQNYYNTSTVNQLLDQWSDQIEESVKQAQDNHEDQISITQWKQAVKKLKSDINNSLIK
ncbi:MAG: CotH kinase family protein [Saccharospirillaceae bacterium]|nr:CotH kinase family protein [Pseudomonadales bacterium]NRB77988.1 CotH kinase family protein [Saccharospirillaceae bacterium]